MATANQDHQLPRVDVVFLAYNGSAQKNATVTLDSICTVSLYELERHLRTKRTERASMGAEAYNHYRWYNAALVSELRTTGKGQPRPLLRAFHWYIETSNVNAFRIAGKQYEAVSLVVAAEVEHWYCARTGGKSAHGSRARVLSCSDQPISMEPTTTAKRHTAPLLKSKIRRTTTTTILERIGEEV